MIYKSTIFFLEIIGYLQKSQVISKSMVSLRSSRINVIQFRFRTNSASGIILYSGGQTEYILAELHDGNLILKIALGTGIYIFKHIQRSGFIYLFLV